ncbi:hypothetical protein [Kordiimonas laminariae]|uniref:hypothetical protein n=1 Tax=Kordiimonas laminariae TaxID=2917717 RepID=UPI001FF3EF10|nr:hypothetical protein [Kordiimonas laminariae]MCK0070009.1 hypothetical protein [Kordiimonas laminariae]
MRFVKFLVITLLASVAVFLTILAVIGHQSDYYDLIEFKNVIFVVLGVVSLILAFRNDWKVTFPSKRNEER